MEAYDSLNTAPECIAADRGDGVGNHHRCQASAFIECNAADRGNTKASLYSFVTYYSVGNNYYKLNIPYYIIKKILYYYYKGYIDFLTKFWWNRFV